MIDFPIQMLHLKERIPGFAKPDGYVADCQKRLRKKKKDAVTSDLSWDEGANIKQ